MLRHFFTQPLPKSLNGIEVGTVAREREQLKTERFCRSTHLLTAMIGGTIPNHDDLAVGFTKPVGELLEKVHGGIAIAFALFPDETGAIREIVSPKPVKPCRKTGGSTGHPIRFPNRRPGIADFHILVQMHLIQIDNGHFATAHAVIQRLKLCDKVCAFFRVGVGQQFLALFPAQTGGPQNRAQGVPADLPFQFGGDPALEFPEGPPTARQFMFVWGAGFDDFYEFGGCLLGKKGGQPP
jgi:hypothetical protein